MTSRPIRVFVLAAAAGLLLSGCSLFGKGPKQHTVIDYQSIEPQKGHGADYDQVERPIPKDDQKK